MPLLDDLEEARLGAALHREAHPDGYQYSGFCDRYREWRGHLDVVLRHVYRAGGKAFVAYYAGPTVGATDRRTGEIGAGVLAAFVATMGGVVGRPWRSGFVFQQVAID